MLDEEDNPVDIEDRDIILEGNFDEVIIYESNIELETSLATSIKTLTLAKESKEVNIRISPKINIELLEYQTEERIFVRRSSKVESKKGTIYHKRSTTNSTTSSKTPVEKQTYIVTINGDAAETTYYTVTSANDLARVE